MDLFYTHISYRQLGIGYSNYFHICHILEPLLKLKNYSAAVGSERGTTANIINELQKSGGKYLLPVHIIF